VPACGETGAAVMVLLMIVLGVGTFVALAGFITFCDRV
jgi:hypothetical protein